ncbi:hypothetical protein HII36_34425 [Nonomuraea sp. NN258]|uniref:hypothetical protein n=1 Tax=Nonomuraea antri TaxID=2730852 RepID=UPI001568F8F5|nr:hypothetical protein [Nonomuraea antri]NRQ36898.1 hypothetical protein [Nonomuraea antri]
MATLGAIAVIFAGRFAVGALAVLAGYRRPDGGVVSDPQWAMFVQVVPILMSLLYVYGVVRLFRLRTFGWLSSVEGRIRGGWLALCGALAFGSVLLGDVAAYFLGRFDGSTRRPFYYWLEGLPLGSSYPTVIVGVLTIAAGALWPYLGWGIAFQASGYFFRDPRIGFALVAAFTVIVEAITEPSYSFLDLLLSILSALYGTWLAWRSGGLEAGMALNAMLLFSGALRQVGAGHLGLVPLDSDGLYVLGRVCGWLFFVLVVTMLVKVMNVRTTSPSRAEAISVRG